MKLSILVWNMNYWQTPLKEAGWDFIRDLKPDIAILNECIPNDSTFNNVHHIQRHPWGVGVFSPYPLTETKIEACHPEALAMAKIDVPSVSIHAISFYGRIVNGFSRSTIHRSLSDLVPHLVKQDLVDWTLLGGDFNASVQFDEVLPAFPGDREHSLFFERLKNYRLHDCLEKFHQGRLQTLRRTNSDYPWQNDYLFAGPKLYQTCTACNVIDDETLYKVSDHNPILATFEL